MNFLLGFLVGLFAGPAIGAYVWPKVVAWWDSHKIPPSDDDTHHA